MYWVYIEETLIFTGSYVSIFAAFKAEIHCICKYITVNSEILIQSPINKFFIGTIFPALVFFIQCVSLYKHCCHILEEALILVLATLVYINLILKKKKSIFVL